MAESLQSHKEAGEILFQVTESIRFGEGSLGKRWHTTAVSLDVEKAFDSIWHDGLRFKLAQLGLPHEICRIVSSFLKERTVYVKINLLYRIPYHSGPEPLQDLYSARCST